MDWFSLFLIFQRRKMFAFYGINNYFFCSPFKKRLRKCEQNRILLWKKSGPSSQQKMHDWFCLMISDDGAICLLRYFYINRNFDEMYFYQQNIAIIRIRFFNSIKSFYGAFSLILIEWIMKNVKFRKIFHTVWTKIFVFFCVFIAYFVF